MLVAAPATLRAVYDQGPRAKGDSREPTRSDIYVGAGQDKRTQVLVGATEPAAIENRLDGKAHDGLGDEAPGPRGDALPEFFALRFGRFGADQHSISA